MELSNIFHSFQPRPAALTIAEIGVNHNGQPDLAFKLIDAAAECGADAVKFQAFIAEQMITRGTPKVSYQQEASPEDLNQFAMLERLQLSREQLKQFKEYAEAKGLIFLSSVFDSKSASALAELGMAAFKIPSGELTNLPLLREVAAYGKPLLISTGMASLGEVEEAVRIVEETGNQQIVLLHCVSNYPAPLESLNLNSLKTLENAFHLQVGFSDHTSGVTAAIAAIALGAVVIEKHFTLSRQLTGPDHQASAEPEEFGQLIKAIRDTESALGSGRKQIMPAERETQKLTRKSIVAAMDISAGELITSHLLDFKRPGTGIPPKELEQVLGKRARHAITKDALLAWTDLADDIST